MLLITAFIHTSQLALPPTGNGECHAFWTVKVVHLQPGATVTTLTARWAAGGSAEGPNSSQTPRNEMKSQVCPFN